MRYPDFMKYVKGTILDKVKEKIASAWTDQVMLFFHSAIGPGCFWFELTEYIPEMHLWKTH